jgi:hypothetical protein
LRLSPPATRVRRGGVRRRTSTTYELRDRDHAFAQAWEEALADRHRSRRGGSPPPSGSVPPTPLPIAGVPASRRRCSVAASVHALLQKIADFHHREVCSRLQHTFVERRPRTLTARTGQSRLLSRKSTTHALASCTAASLSAARSNHDTGGWLGLRGERGRRGRSAVGGSHARPCHQPRAYRPPLSILATPCPIAGLEARGVSRATSGCRPRISQASARRQTHTRSRRRANLRECRLRPAPYSLQA